MKIETSIIIPAYNAAKYIDETIQSVLDQTYRNWELIIVDDGSTDNTSDVISRYLSDERIQYVYQNNSGVSTARNNGILRSKGQFVAFLDADDIWLNENLNKKIELLKYHKFDWVFCDMRIINRYSEYLNEEIQGTDQNILDHYLLWDRTVVPGPCSNIIIKRCCLEKGLQFDPKFSTAADQDFCINLSTKYIGKRIPKSLFSYRVLPDSMSKNISVMEKDHINVYKKADTNNLFKSYWFKRKCFSNLYIILAGSWWKNGENKTRGLYFIFLSIISYPPNIAKLIKKLWNE